MAERDYSVGYKKPPREHRFKPGQSGNPRGRPKGIKSLDQRLQEELDRPVTIKMGARAQKVPVWRAVVMKLAEAAMKGEFRAMQHVLSLRIARGAKDEEVDEAVQQLTDDDLLVLEQALRRRRSEGEPK